MGAEATSAAKLLRDRLTSSITELIEEDEALSQGLTDKYLGLLGKLTKNKETDSNTKTED